MDRRRFLAVLGSAAGGAVLAGCASSAAASDAGSAGGAAEAPVGLPAAPDPVAPKIPLEAPPVQAVTTLPGEGRRVLLGIDDGISAQAVRDWCHFVTRYDQRLVFFANGCYESWAEVKPDLAPLVESGRIQLANHTWSHPKLTLCSDDEVVRQLRTNADHFRRLYGVELAPWWRPPYGLHDPRVDRVAAAEGYHAAIDWANSFADWNPTSPDYYLARADACFQPGYVVLAHANKPDVAPVHEQLAQLLHDRGLDTVTLRDVYRS